MKRLFFLFTTLNFLFLGNCGSGCGPVALKQGPLEGNWICTSITAFGKTEAAPPTLRFNVPEKSATGKGGCNGWFASYESDGAGAVKFGIIGATKMFCADPVGQIESAFFKAVGDADRYELSGSGLRFFKGKTELAVFEKE